MIKIQIIGPNYWFLNLSKVELPYVYNHQENVLVKVMQGVVVRTWRKWFNLGQNAFVILERKAQMNMKVWKAWCSFVKYKIIHKSTNVIILACPWLRSCTTLCLQPIKLILLCKFYLCWTWFVGWRSCSKPYMFTSIKVFEETHGMQ